MEYIFPIISWVLVVLAILNFSMSDDTNMAITKKRADWIIMLVFLNVSIIGLISLFKDR